jgi:guanylate kinase
MDYHQRRFRHIALVGLSGSGKTTLSKRIIKNHGEDFASSVSYTNRLPRPTEIRGVDYNFVTTRTFGIAIQHGAFLEWNNPYGTDCYGTVREKVSTIIRVGKSAIFDVDIDGALHLKKWYKDDLLTVFLNTPIETVEKRLRTRGTESEETIFRRIRRGEQEEYPRMHELDYVVSYGDGANPDFVINEIINKALRPQ